MGKFQQKDNSGSLFKNDRREKDAHPHATGSAMIDGIEYWVSAWTKDGQKGKWQSLAFKRKEDRTAGGVKHNPGRMNEEDADDRVPF